MSEHMTKSEAKREGSRGVTLEYHKPSQNISLSQAHAEGPTGDACCWDPIHAFVIVREALGHNTPAAPHSKLLL